MKKIHGNLAISDFLGVSVPENIGEILSDMDYGRRGVDKVDSLLIPEAEGSPEGFVRFVPPVVSMMSIDEFVGILRQNEGQSEENLADVYVLAQEAGSIVMTNFAGPASSPLAQLSA